MYRHDIHELSEKERIQFNELKKRIIDVAFVKESNYPKYKKIKTFRRNESRNTRILKNGDTQSGIHKLSTVLTQRHNIEDHDEIIESFIMELTYEIMRFEKDRNKNNAKNLLHEINVKHINKVKDYLKHMGFRRNAIKKVIKILEQDLIDREKQILNSRDFKSFYKIDPKSTAWIHRENEFITKIKSLYKRESRQNNGPIKTISLFNYDLLSHPWLLKKDGTPKLKKLSDREIISNMAYIFAETNFWDYQPTNKEITEDMKSLNSKSEEQLNKLKYEKRLELYFDRIKKRLQIDKKLNEKIRVEHRQHESHHCNEISPPIKKSNKATLNFFYKFCKQPVLKIWNFFKNAD
jgi:hypothetical protein